MLFSFGLLSKGPVTFNLRCSSCLPSAAAFLPSLCGYELFYDFVIRDFGGGLRGDVISGYLLHILHWRTYMIPCNTQQ